MGKQNYYKNDLESLSKFSTNIQSLDGPYLVDQKNQGGKITQS